MTPCRDHGVPWKHGKCQRKPTCVHRQHERKQVVCCLTHKRGRAGTRCSHTTAIDECLNHKGKDPGSIGSIPPGSGRWAVTLECSVLRCGLGWSSTQQHRHRMMVFWSSSAIRTQLSKKRKFIAEIVFHTKIERVSIKCRARPLGRAASVMARKVAKTTGLKSVLGCSYVA